jgi:hypothetical protein
MGPHIPFPAARLLPMSACSSLEPHRSGVQSRGEFHVAEARRAVRRLFLSKEATTTGGAIMRKSILRRLPLMLLALALSEAGAQTWKAQCDNLEFTFSLDDGVMNVGLLGDVYSYTVLADGRKQERLRKQSYVLARGQILGKPTRSIVTGYVADPAVPAYREAEPPVQIVLNRERQTLYIFYTHPQTGRQEQATLCRPKIEVFR